MIFKRILFAAFALLLVTGACKKEPFENQPLYLKILGQWQIVKIETLDAGGKVKSTLIPDANSYFNFDNNKGNAFERVINNERSTGTMAATEFELLLDYTAGEARGVDAVVTPSEAHFREVLPGRADWVYYLKRN